MEKLGEIFIQGKMINLDTSSVEELERYLQSAQKEKEKFKNKLDDILEEIYI